MLHIKLNKLTKLECSGLITVRHVSEKQNKCLYICVMRVVIMWRGAGGYFGNVWRRLVCARPIILLHGYLTCKVGCHIAHTTVQEGTG